MRTDELKKEFTLKITRANATELIVILYDMILVYIKEAGEFWEEKDKPDFDLVSAAQRWTDNLERLKEESAAQAITDALHKAAQGEFPADRLKIPTSELTEQESPLLC